MQHQLRTVTREPSIQATDDVRCPELGSRAEHVIADPELQQPVVAQPNPQRVDGQLAAAIAANSRFHVIAADDDANKVARVRKTLYEAGLHRSKGDLLKAIQSFSKALELDPAAIERGLEAASIVPGRLQPVVPSRGSAPFPALVDYAHTPDALEAALTSVRRLSDRRMAVVFGCGGERDRGKRPMMGEIAGRLADFAVPTSDNPRREDPASILAEVEEGLVQGLRASAAGAEEPAESDTVRKEHRVEADRRQAIRLAVKHAAEGEAKGESWLVVVAGKGHETTQDLGGEIIDFDDRTELTAALDRITSEAGSDGGRREAHG